MVRGGNVRRAYALLFVMFCGVTFLFMASPAAASDIALSSTGAGNLSVYELISKWGGAMIDPSTYTTIAHVDGFFSFLVNETFLSSLSSNSFGSLSRDSILGTIPNIFFVICIICVLLSVAVGVMEMRKLDMLRRIVKK